MSLTLVIANKNYSSWSMRPWVLLHQFDIPFAEVLLKFHSAEWTERIAMLSPSGLVPVLWDGQPGEANAIAIWDSVAIFEYVAERFPEKAIWPRSPEARAFARSVVAEMHAGFRALRSAMPMNIRNQHPGKGQSPEVARDLARIESLWATARTRFGQSGPFLFGDFSAADAMFAPVVMRIATYHPAISAESARYCDAVQHATSVAAWNDASRRETEFVAEDEPYCKAPG